MTGSRGGWGKDREPGRAREGCDSVVAARTEEEADPKLPGTIHSTVEEIRALGVRAIPVRTDITDEASVQAAVQTAIDEFGRIDILINNAGVMSPGRLWEIPLKRWDLVTRVNVRGAVACCQAVLPHMIERGSGSIITLPYIAPAPASAGTPPSPATQQARQHPGAPLPRC